jgi:hypothetical protein
VAVTVKLPVPAFAEAENTIDVFEVALTANEPDGFEATPEGKLLSVTCTVPAKPFSGATDRFIAALVAPCCTICEFWENPIEKSGSGGGGGGGGLEDPPPQPADTNSKMAINRAGAR